MEGIMTAEMTGAESLAKTMLACSVEVCFSNPGTSEMHFVAALDQEPGIRSVLGLHESTVTGAADGYGRMLDRPAATMLHCGPGMANGLSQLHNARRARSPILNIVGDQATYHRPFDAPLTADTEGWAHPVSVWTRSSPTARDVGRHTAEAICQARSRKGISTLILPSDSSWSKGGEVATPLADIAPPQICNHAVERAATLLLSEGPNLIVLGGRALRKEPLECAHQIAHRTGATLISMQAVARIERGRGRHPIDRIPYSGDQAQEMLKSFRNVIVIEAPNPAISFAYPNKFGRPYPADATVQVVATLDQDGGRALQMLANAVGADNIKLPALSESPEINQVDLRGSITPAKISAALTAFLPENAIVVDESITFGRTIFGLTQHAAPHDWLTLTGGAIGSALPLAVGAAVACPDRRVIALEGDGSAMYTLQALWTMARETLNATVVILANHKYAVLQGELKKVGANEAGPIAMSMLDIGSPRIDWVKMSNSMGVEAIRIDSMETFVDVFRSTNTRKGPFLIELVI